MVYTAFRWNKHYSGYIMVSNPGVYTASLDFVLQGVAQAWRLNGINVCLKEPPSMYDYDLGLIGVVPCYQSPETCDGGCIGYTLVKLIFKLTRQEIQSHDHLYRSSLKELLRL